MDPLILSLTLIFYLLNIFFNVMIELIVKLDLFTCGFVLFIIKSIYN